MRTLEPRPERTGERQLGPGGGQLDTSRGLAANVGLQVWTGRISSLPSTSNSRTTAGTEASVIGQFVAGGGQQRSWLTSARFLPNRTVIARHTKEMVLSTFMTAIPEGAGP